MRDLIRRCLRANYDPVALTGDFAVAGMEPEKRELRPAAVLIPLVEHDDGLTVLLTQRTNHLANHAGQVSFPGGGAEQQDADPVATALRETEEELGLASSHIEIAGFLDLYQTVTGFLVTPVVGFVKPGFELEPDPFEVAEVFEVPLSFILDPRNHHRESRMFRGERRYFYVLPYQNYYIWGATAAMLVSFYKKLEPDLAVNR